MKKIGLLKLITLYKILRDSLDMIKIFKSFTYPAVRMHPNAKKTAPMHIFTEFLINNSLFLKNEKKAKKGIRDAIIKTKTKSKIEILNINKIKIIGKRIMPV